MDKVIQILEIAGYKVEKVWPLKNGIPTEGITIAKDEDSDIKPVYYKKDMDLSDPLKTAGEIIQTIEAANPIELDEFMNILHDWTQSRERVFTCLVGCRENVPENVPGEPFLGMYKYARVNLDHATVIVTDEMMEDWDINPDVLFHFADMNACSWTGATNILDVLDGNTTGKVVAELPCVVSNIETQGNYGAYGAFTDEVLHMLSKGYDDDLFIIPSSIHEVLVLPTSLGTAEEIKAIHQKLSPNYEETKLTESVYMYLRDKEMVVQV